MNRILAIIERDLRRLRRSLRSNRLCDPDRAGADYSRRLRRLRHAHCCVYVCAAGCADADDRR